jgi:hypothetical protein
MSSTVLISPPRSNYIPAVHVIPAKNLHGRLSSARADGTVTLSADQIGAQAKQFMATGK